MTENLHGKRRGDFGGKRLTFNDQFSGQKQIEREREMNDLDGGRGEVGKGGFQ